MESKKWTGKAIDRMAGKVVYQSGRCDTWEEAQKRAEKKAGKSDRYKVVVA